MLKQSKSEEQRNILILRKSQAEDSQKIKCAGRDQALQLLIKYYLNIKSLQKPSLKLIKIQLSEILDFYSSFHTVDFYQQLAFDKKNIFIDFFKKASNSKAKTYHKDYMLDLLVTHTFKISCKTMSNSDIKDIEREIMLINQQQKAIIEDNNDNLNRQNTEDNTLININQRQKYIEERQIIDLQMFQGQKQMQIGQNIMKSADNPQAIKTQKEFMEIEVIKNDNQEDFVDISSVFPQH